MVGSLCTEDVMGRRFEMPVGMGAVVKSAETYIATYVFWANCPSCNCKAWDSRL